MIKKLSLIIFILFAFAAFSNAKTYHLFFIAQKTADKPSVGYTSWVINSGGQEYYFAESGDPRPEGTTVRDITMLIGSSGANDMLYYITSKSNVAQIASVADEYAGGSISSYGAAWADFIVRSFLQIGVHSSFPAGAAAKKVLPVRWKVAGEWVEGMLEDWETAGFPLDSANINVGHRVLGVD